MQQGRPTKYTKQTDKIAAKVISLGGTEVDVAEVLGICVATVNAWKHTYPSFSEALKNARDNYDVNIERALAQRALGYSHRETRVGFYEGQAVTEEIIKHVPPDIGAIKLWLHNRQPERWRAQPVEAVDETELESRVIEIIDASGNASS